MKKSHLAVAIMVALSAHMVSQQALASSNSDVADWKDGPYQLRLRGVYLDPANRSNAFSIQTPCAGIAPCFTTVPSNAVYLGSEIYAELSGEWYFTSHLSTELALAVPTNSSTQLKTPKLNLGDIKLMPNTLTLKYNFAPQATFRPYVGAGVDYTKISSSNFGIPATSNSVPTSLSTDGSSFGWVAQAGFDVRIARSWFLNADVRYLGDVDTNIKSSSGRLTTARIDPMLYSIGFGYRFGGSRIAAAAPVVAVAAVATPAPVAPSTPVAVVTPPPPAPAPEPIKDSDRDGVIDSLDQCPNSARGARVDQQGCDCDISLEVHFASDSSTLTDTDIKAIDSLIPQLKQVHFSNGEVDGYTDSKGSDTYNKKLSERRAKAVADYLATHGITGGFIKVAGFGEADPVADNATAEGRAHNRRVVLRRTDCR